MEHYPAPSSNFSSEHLIASQISINSINSNHKYRSSIDSLYSSIYNCSISISESSSNADSETIGKIQTINKELTELLTSRITAFLYFAEDNHLKPEDQSDSSRERLGELKDSLESSLEKLEKDDGSFVLVSKVLKNLSDLQKCYEGEQEKLRSHQDEMKTLETEENELNLKLEEIESKMARLVLERNSVKYSCNCGVF